MNGALIHLLAFPLAFLSIACAQPNTSEIRIGLMTELTGTFAANGADCKHGYELARRTLLHGDQINGYHLQFIYGDTKGEAKSGISEFLKLVESDGIQVGIANRSQVVMAINPLSKQKKIPFVAVVGYASLLKDNDYAFRFWPSTHQEGAALAQRVLASGFKSAAIVTWEDEWTVSIREAFADEFKRGGGRIVMDELCGDLQTDFTSIITRLRSLAPQAIFVNLGLNNAGVFIRKLREQGLRQPLFGSYYTRKKEVAESAGSQAIEGLVLEEIAMRGEKFQRGLKQLFGNVEASAITFACYTGLAGIFQALRDTPGIRDPQQLHAALLAMKEVPLLDSTLKLSGREALYDLDFKVIRQGQVVNLE